jgi:multiple sugar transport system permease protein
LVAAPGLAALLALILLPLLFTLATSAFDYTLLEPRHDRFVGLRHYLAALGSPEYRRSLLLTAAFAAAAALVELTVGFAVALALNAVERGRAFYQAVLLLPLAISPVAAGLAWRTMLHPSLGVADRALALAGVGPVNWLGDPGNALRTLVAVDAWHHVSFTALLLLAGLSSLPREPYEAARMEGAGTLRSFLHVTLPLMRPVIAVALLLRLVLAVRTFDLVYVMTRGGPGRATDLASHLVYRQAFVGLDVGRACAMAAILLLIVLPPTARLHRSMRSLAAAPSPPA